MNKTPAVRFIGFAEDWEQRKLGELFKYEQPQAYIVESTEYDDKNDIPVLTAGQSFILGYTDEKFGIKKASAEKPVIIFDDFTTSSHYVDFPFKVKSSAMKLLTLSNPKDDIHCVFNVLQNIGYVPVSHERHWISTFAKFDVLLPNSADEQAKIGQYFANLDSLITLHQRKYDKLTNVKKSMLEKMFPKNGSNVPEIRFKGFTDAWEQRKLGDVLVLLKDGTHGTHKDAESGPLLLSAKNIKNGTIQWDESDRRISEDEYNNIHSNFKLQKGDVLLTIVGSIGETAILSQSKGVTFQRSVAFLRPSDKISSEFLYSEIQGQKFQKALNVRKSTSAQPGIYLGDLGTIPIEFPTSDEEQMQIGSYFQNLDNLITLHHRKFEKLEQIKQAMLHKMFV